MTFNELTKVHQEQITELDCGPACLSMIAKYLSIPVRYSELRNDIKRNNQGVSLDAMIECAKSKGIVLAALKGAISDLKREWKPFILVMKNKEGLHYVMAWRFDKRGVWISDPAEGRPKKQTWQELETSWTSYGLRLENTPMKRVKRIGAPWVHWFQHDKPILVGIALGTLILSILALAGVFFSKWLLDSALPNGEDLRKPIILLAFILLFSAVVGILKDYGLILHFERFNRKELKAQFDKLWVLSTRSFDTFSTGDLVARLQDYRRIQAIITEFISGVGIQMVLIIIISTVLIMLHPLLAWPVLLPIPWYFLWVKPRSGRLNERQKNSLKSKAILENSYWQWLTHRSFWKVSDRSDRIRIQHESLLGSWIKNRKELSKELVLLSYSYEFISIIGFLLVLHITTGAYRHDALSLGGLIACISLWGMIAPAWKSSISWYPRWIEAQWVSKRVAHWESEENVPEVLEAADCNHVYFWSMNSSLSFNKSPLKQGELIHLSGSSGSGKTTLLRLLLGDLKWNRGGAWNNCAWLPQDTPILSGTIAENLLFYSSEPMEWKKAAEIWSDWGLTKWIDQMPLKWATPVGKGERALSGGQKQLIAWMRIVASNKKIWLLDEPTAHLDEQWANHLLKKLYLTRKERAVLLVSHRASEIGFNPTDLWEMELGDEGSVLVK